MQIKTVSELEKNPEQGKRGKNSCYAPLTLYPGAVHKVRHAIFGQFLLPPPVTLRHTSRDPPKVRHTSRTFKRPSTKSRTKGPLYKFCLNCSRWFLSGGFCQGVFCLEGFVQGGFCSFPFCQNTSV